MGTRLAGVGGPRVSRAGQWLQTRRVTSWKNPGCVTEFLKTRNLKRESEHSCSRHAHCTCLDQTQKAYSWYHWESVAQV